MRGTGYQSNNEIVGGSDLFSYYILYYVIGLAGTLFFVHHTVTGANTSVYSAVS
jgi:hypothetical protein